MSIEPSICGMKLKRNFIFKVLFRYFDAWAWILKINYSQMRRSVAQKRVSIDILILIKGKLKSIAQNLSKQ